ncbi:MAG: DNA polymerase III subunit chi [Chlamydiia bacterium]|nr:DNA polymerase III subunit chi [Chlamydiia bacterium]
MNRDIKVTFLQVKNDQHKREKIIHLAKEYFEKKEPLLIHLPHQKALEYVDLLLWRSPLESFLPHAVKDAPCKDLIVLTTSHENPNGSRSILNLCPSPVDNENLSFLKIYELEDLASTQKNKSAQERYKHYKECGYMIVTI